MKPNKLNEFLLAFYIVYLAFAKYLISIWGDYSFEILAIPTVAVVLLSALANRKRGMVIAYPLMTGLVVLLIFAVHLMLFSNDVTAAYAYNFVIYGLVPLFLVSRVQALGSFFKYFALLNIPTVLFMGLDPLNGYVVTGDYMGYGYFVMLPAFVSFYIARKYLRYIWLLPLEVASFLMIIIFANQGAALSAVSLVLLCNILVDRQTLRRLGLYFLLLLTGLIVAINISPILRYGIEFADNNGQSSYALKKALQTIEGDSDGLSGRDEVWESANALLLERPLTGSGIAANESRNGTYAHNIFLEVGISFGLLGVVALAVYMVYYGRLMLHKPRGERLTYVLGISAGLAPLLFSLQPFLWYFFWIFTINPQLEMKNLRAKEGDLDASKN